MRDYPIYWWIGICLDQWSTGQGAMWTLEPPCIMYVCSRWRYIVGLFVCHAVDRRVGAQWDRPHTPTVVGGGGVERTLQMQMIHPVTLGWRTFLELLGRSGVCAAEVQHVVGSKLLYPIMWQPVVVHYGFITIVGAIIRGQWHKNVADYGRFHVCVPLFFIALRQPAATMNWKYKILNVIYVEYVDLVVNVFI